MTKDGMTEQNCAWQQTDVVLAIPRQRVRLGFILVSLVLFSVVIGVITYQLLPDAPESDGLGQYDNVLLKPVTFIPPTPEPHPKVSRVSVSADDDPFVGPLDAPIVIIEFSDYQCYYCGEFARSTQHPLLAMYGDQIRFVYRDFIFYGPVSLQAAVASECADEQGAFWLYHDLLFEFQDELNRDRMVDLARSIDLDMDRFSACLDDPMIEAEVQADTDDGHRLGIRGTPTFFINGRVFVGAQPLEAFMTVIEEELAATTTTPVVSDPPDDKSQQDLRDDP
jgi:protein-disulfide isomerase